jgi:peptide/nickel transport system ATP-binding protein
MSATGARLDVEALRVIEVDSGNDIVDHVSFQVQAGETLGLVGESGSGKTTVALALLGHARTGLRIDHGSVLIEGDDVVSFSATQLQELRGARVSYVPQDPGTALNPVLKIGTQLREVLKIHASHHASQDELDTRIDEVLSEVRLDGTKYLNVYPHQLSGGQQQRVALAMAFLMRPSVIVLDEPTTGLDVSTQRHVLETIRDLCQRHRIAAVFVSHDLAVIADLSDRVAVMYAGRIVELGAMRTHRRVVERCCHS